MRDRARQAGSMYAGAQWKREKGCERSVARRFYPLSEGVQQFSNIPGSTIRAPDAREIGFRALGNNLLISYSGSIVGRDIIELMPACLKRKN